MYHNSATEIGYVCWDKFGEGCMLRDYSACQVQLSADTLATATSASDLASPASADVRSAAEQRNGLAAT
jgi:hypothetical protein